MIVIPCVKKTSELIASHVCENIFVLKITEFIERQKEKKIFLKYRALFYHN